MIFESLLADSKLDESNKAHAINWATLAFVLIENGIITQEQYDASRQRAIAHADQEWAKRRDKSPP